VHETQQSPTSVRTFSEPSRNLSWREYFEKALQESDPIKLLALIHATEKALLCRGSEMGANEIYDEERVAMGSACDTLGTLRISKLGWPDPYA
jgi:hypothetical protein